MHVVEGLGKVELGLWLTTPGGLLTFGGEGKHELSVYELAVRPRLEIKILDD